MVKHKYVLEFAFVVITLFYLATRWLIFRGFNGTDDLHYAMLSSRMLNHTFNPFVSDDIFCGRIVLIGFQSIIYRLAGINVLTTQIGTILATVTTCYITVFKLIKPKTYLQIFLACSLFYFNPVLLAATGGIMPDPYIMLSGIFFLLITKELLSEKTKKKLLIISFLLGIFIGISLLIKETAILFLFFSAILILVQKPKQFLVKIALIILGFLFVVSAICIYYYVNTGDFFFKVTQINHSDYRNTHHQGIVLKNLAIRLSYGPWMTFIVQGFYPLIIATFVLSLQFLKKGWLYVKNNYYMFSFLILLVLSIFSLLILLVLSTYFPFSLQDFKPLLVDGRQFLFLLPLAVVLSSDYLYSYLVHAQNMKIIFWLFLGLLIICMHNTGNKWQWMIYGLITVLLFVGPQLRRYHQISIFMVCFILWLSLLEKLFFKNYLWFKEMQVMSKNIAGNCFYFIDNDNMMHWELLKKFDATTNSYYSLEKKPFFMFVPYYSKINLSLFKPGWLIVNNVYPQPSAQFQGTLYALKKTNTFTNYIVNGHVEAFYIADSTTLKQLIANAD